MKTSWQPWLLLCALGCSGAHPGGVDPAPIPPAPNLPDPAGSDAPATTLERPPDRTVDRALDRALHRGWQDLRLVAECRFRDRWSTLEVFSNGVGIWNGTTQLRWTVDELRGVLEALRSAGFPGMDELYGGQPGPEVEPPKPVPMPPGGPPAAAVQISCRLFLELDGISKQVAQRFRGEQNEAFRQLVEAILALANQTAERAGVTATSFDDALARLAAGELAPEIFRLTVSRQPGWLLQLVARRATLRPQDLATGLGERAELELGGAQIVRLAARLAEEGFGGLPPNLWAESYTDVRIAVLGFDHKVQGRRFAGLSPTDHGALQHRFDRVVAELETLHRTIEERLRDGL